MTPAEPAECEAIAEGREAIRRFYQAKVRAWGPVPFGVDWSDALTQRLRLVQLLKICDHPDHYAWNDLGCGYGALLELFKQRYGKEHVDYVGIDLCSEMIGHAVRLWSHIPGVRFAVGGRCSRVAHYSIASGIFNVQLMKSESAWEELIAATMKELRAASTKGVAINFKLAGTTRTVSHRPVYRTRPERWIPFCRNVLGTEVDVLSGYGMLEFSLHLHIRDQ